MTNAIDILHNVCPLNASCWRPCSQTEFFDCSGDRHKKEKELDTVTVNAWRSLPSSSHSQATKASSVLMACSQSARVSPCKSTSLSVMYPLLILSLGLLCSLLRPPSSLLLSPIQCLWIVLSARWTVSEVQGQGLVSGLNVKVFPYPRRIHSHNGPSRLSCFSVRRVQTRPLFSTSSDASMLFFPLPPPLLFSFFPFFPSFQNKGWSAAIFLLSDGSLRAC